MDFSIQPMSKFHTVWAGTSLPAAWRSEHQEVTWTCNQEERKQSNSNHTENFAVYCRPVLPTVTTWNHSPIIPWAKEIKRRCLFSEEHQYKRQKIRKEITEKSNGMQEFKPDRSPTSHSGNFHVICNVPPFPSVPFEVSYDWGLMPSLTIHYAGWAKGNVHGLPLLVFDMCLFELELKDERNGKGNVLRRAQISLFCFCCGIMHWQLELALPDHQHKANHKGFCSLKWVLTIAISVRTLSHASFCQARGRNPCELFS